MRKRERSPELDIKMRERKGRGQGKDLVAAHFFLPRRSLGGESIVLSTFQPTIARIRGCCKKPASSVDAAALNLLLALGVFLGGPLGVFSGNFPWGVHLEAGKLLLSCPFWGSTFRVLRYQEIRSF